MSQSLPGAVVRGALVQLATSTPAKLLGIALTILAARALSPGLYGEFNLAITIYGVSDLLTNPSMFTYFVRSPQASARALDSAWTFSALRGLALTALFWALSTPLAAAFDAGQGVALLLQLLSTTFLLAGLRNPWVSKIYHELDYARIALIESLGGFAGNLVALGLLAWTQSPAALAAGVVLSQLVSCALTWRYAPQRPKLALDRGELLVVWRFARFLLLNNIIIYLLLKLDDAFLGKAAGLAMLGLYGLAYKVANDSVLFLITTLRQVLLPAFVKLAEDRAALAKAGLRAVGTLSALSWTLATMVFAAAHPLMTLIAPDERWRGSELVLQALMPFVLIRAVNGVFGSLLMTLGKPQALTAVAGAQLVGMLPLMAAGYALGLSWQQQPLHGVLGLTCAIALLNLGANLALGRYTSRLLELPLGRATGLMWIWAPGGALAAWLGQAAQVGAWHPGVHAALGLGVSGAVMLALWELLTRVLALHEVVDSPWALLRRARRARGSRAQG